MKKKKKLKGKDINTEIIGRSNDQKSKLLKNSVYGIMGPYSCVEHIGHVVVLNNFDAKYKYSFLTKDEMSNINICVKYNDNSVIIVKDEYFTQEMIEDAVKYVKKNISKKLVRCYYAIASVILSCVDRNSHQYGSITREEIRYRSKCIQRAFKSINPIIHSYVNLVEDLYKKVSKKYENRFLSSTLIGIICAAIVFECDDFMKSCIRGIYDTNRFPYEQLLSHVILNTFRNCPDEVPQDFVRKYIFDMYDMNVTLTYPMDNVPCSEPIKDNACFSEFEGDTLNIYPVRE